MFILARTATGRPSLQHATDDLEVTLCGIPMRGWSRAYLLHSIPQILCKKCGKAIGQTG